MIDSSQTTYYLTYAALSAGLGVAYLKLKSMEGLTITTKEFKNFQNTFLLGYSLMILGELIASASFYHSLSSLGLSLLQITKLYIVSMVATTACGVLIEIVDVGSRKDKCVGMSNNIDFFFYTYIHTYIHILIFYTL